MCLCAFTCVCEASSPPQRTDEDSKSSTGYTLVWQEEFNGNEKLPDSSEWWFETGNYGWGNYEIQNYIKGATDRDTCALVSGGTLKITAKKVKDEVLSVQLNTKRSWVYGYFEARMKLPAGRGTWPAFWMMPDVPVSTIHCNAYNHTKGTQKSGNKPVSFAQSDFHVYAMKWTENFIKGMWTVNTISSS